MTTTQSRFRQAFVTLVALTVVLSGFGLGYGPVGTATAQSVSVSNSPSTTTAAPGENVTITTTFTATDVNGPGVEAQLPTGWIGEISDSDGGFPNVESGGNVLQVVWLSSGTYEVTYEVQVPEDASDGDYTVTTEGSGIDPGDPSTPDDDVRITDQTTTTITVETTPDNQDPSASFTYSPTDPTAGESVSFDASGSSDTDGSIASYDWDFGDGSTGSGATPSHTYDSAGSYTVELTVTDDDGATATAQQTVTVSETTPDNQDPSASFTYSPSSPTTDDSVSFDASASNDPDGSIASYDWDFGDGSTGSGATPSHTYSSSGTYTVELTVTDDDGATATTQQTVTVSEPTTPTDMETSVSMEPASGQTFAGGTTTFDLVVDDANGGVGAYSATISVDDSSVAQITDVDLKGSPAGQTTNVNLAADGSSVSIDAALMDTADTGSVSVATITVQGGAAGTTNLTPSVDALGNEQGTSYTVTDTSGALLDVTTKSTSVSLAPSSDEVTVDETTTFDLVVDNANGGVGAYTATISLDDSSVAQITDVELLGNPAEQTSQVDIAADGSSVTIDAALMNTADTGSVAVATITVEGENAGSTDLSTSVAALGDEDGNNYAVTGTTGASLEVTEVVVGNFADPVNDLDSDSKYEDINGDGNFNIVDVQALFANLDDEAIQNNPDKFDFNNDGTVNIVDVQALFFQLTG
jgi:PKD repeat protein